MTHVINCVTFHLLYTAENPRLRSIQIIACPGIAVTYKLTHSGIAIAYKYTAMADIHEVNGINGSGSNACDSVYRPITYLVILLGDNTIMKPIINSKKLINYNIRTRLYLHNQFISQWFSHNKIEIVKCYLRELTKKSKV